jgi:CubicO group peptidase (beta-lactamase class C family)
VIEVEGLVAPGFERVGEVLAHGARLQVGERERVADLGSGGGAFCAFVDGECVVDIWAGHAGPDIRWESDARAVIMSATKGLTTLCAHILCDRGDLDIDAPVVKYWPEFGAAGKEHTLVRHLLSHQSGAIGVPDADRILSWEGDGWENTPGIAAAIAAAPAAWEPGTRHGYHGVTFGWLIGEIVRRVSGASLGAFFDAEVARPLDVACHIGTSDEEQAHVATVIEWTPRSASRGGALTTIDPESLAGRSVLAGSEGHLFADQHGTPRFASFMNTPAVLRAEIGAINATADARGLARIFAELAAGDRLVSRTSVALFSEEQVCGRDAVMRVPTRWALGYTREPPSLIPGLPRQHGPNDEAFGHMGAGGQIAFADPVARIGCGFVRNHLENQAMPLMGACLVDALYRCAGATR